MKLRLHRLRLPLEFEFTIARGSVSTRSTLIVELEHEGQRGFGEASENAFYGHTQDSVSASLEGCREKIETYTFGHPQQLWAQLHVPLAEDLFALSAVDCAAWDLFGKLQRKTTYQLLALSWKQVPPSSYTIGIDRRDVMIKKLKTHAGWPIYKIKLGTDRDVEIVRALRDVTPATFRVDANGGWSPEETIDNASRLQPLGVELLEQPLPATASAEQLAHVFEQSALPVFADESCQTPADVDACAPHFHGINVKLSKCGGITPAVGMLRRARQLGLKTMLGCMVESSVGISAAAQLAPLLDYADLDGAALLSDDPASGVRVIDGRIELTHTHGNGVSFPVHQTHSSDRRLP
ncbi:MAG: dipeptide epimerase [Planctomycetaceae bacterium]|nr:dipeptide epimerase [Planctomycetaceae bacterium]